MFLVHACYDGGGGWNQNARLASIFEFVETGSFRIDPYVHATARGLGTHDWAKAGDHYYPNKAPGVVFLGVPAYFLLYHAERFFGAEPYGAALTARNAWAVNLAVSVVPTALASGLLFLLAIFLDFAESDALFTALCYSFATLVFPFDTTLFGHTTTAAFLLAAFFFAVKETRRAIAVAGFFAAFALLTDYLAGIGLVLLGAFVLLRRRPVFSFLGGATAPCLALATYQTLVFGSPFHSAFGQSNPAFLASDATAAGAFTGFSPLVLLKLLVYPARGLFVYCPVLLAAGLSLCKPRNVAPWRWCCLAIIAVALLLVASFNGWHGGWSSGPRYLVPFMPFACLLLPEFSRLRTPARWITLALAAVSGLEMWMVSFVDVLAPSDVSEPFTNFFLPRLLGREYFEPKFLFGRYGFLAPRLISLALLLAAITWVWRAHSTRREAPGP